MSTPVAGVSSDTPLTDKYSVPVDRYWVEKTFGADFEICRDVVTGFFARSLERERDAAEAEMDRLRKRLSDCVSTERARCLSAIPTTWLDPLLTGGNAVIGEPPYGCPEVETLLRAIRKRLEAL